MARRYAVSGPSESSTGPKTSVAIIGSTAVRPIVYDIMAGSSTTPADQTWQFVAARFTASGTGASAPTPELLDSGDVAAVCTTKITHSAEPTYAAVFLIDFSLHQKATFRWVASPGGEIIGSAAADDGIGVKNHLASAALVARVTAHWAE